MKGAILRRVCGSVFITFAPPVVGPAPEVTPEVTPEVRVLIALKGEMSRQAIQSALELKDDEHFRKAYLVPALEAGLIEMTIPDKPRSSRQKYRLTDKGRKMLQGLKSKVQGTVPDDRS